MGVIKAKAGKCMKQETDFDIKNTFILIFLIIALLCLNAMLTNTGFLSVLYFLVVTGIAIPLCIFIGSLLATYVAKSWK